jgi:prevent-host-death family protein
MPVYTVHEAKTNLSKLIECAERGEEVVIARGNKPVVKLIVAGEKPKTRRQPGMLKGVIELKLWEEGYEGDPLNEPAARKPDATSS